jgi:hypothetical protein
VKAGVGVDEWALAAVVVVVEEAVSFVAVASFAKVVAAAAVVIAVDVAVPSSAAHFYVLAFWLIYPGDSVLFGR